MDETAAKDHLKHYLQEGRETLVWKLDGLSEYDVRRPLVPTGTNLLGLVKHVAGTESLYFGAVFGRPFPEDLPWMEEEAGANSDMWATLDESRESVVDLYRRVWAHSDATIDALSLDAPGHVTWWRNPEVTLHRILAHMTVETHRHVGHADIARELVDGAVGLRLGNENLPHEDAAWWEGYRARLEETALAAGR